MYIQPALLLLLLPLLSFSQNIETLEVNDLRVNITPKGFFLHPDQGFPSVTFPAHDPIKKGVISWASLFFTAQTDSSTFFKTTSGYDFTYGPKSNIRGMESYKERYNKAFKISLEEIKHHRLYYNTSGYKVPDNIRNWPAHGETSYNESYHLAPFVDVNGSGKYEPEKGDYPQIKGDEAVIVILNDDYNERWWGASPLDLDIVIMIYAYNNPGSVLHQTFFANFKITNKSTNIYHDFYLGLLTDIDIGYAYDDYAGTDTSLNYYFSYNAQAFDKGVNGFGYYPPAQAVVFLNKPLVSTAFPVWHFAIIPPLSYYFSMQRGTAPYNPNRFFYPGNLDIPGDKTEITDKNSPGDRLVLGSTGPYVLHPEETICLDVAFPLSSGSTYLHNARNLAQVVSSVKSFYNNNLRLCEKLVLSTGNSSPALKSLLVHPNPSGEGIFHLTLAAGLSSDKIDVTIHDALGRIVHRGAYPTANLHLDLSGHPAGIYFVHARSGHDLFQGKLIRK